MAEQEDCNSSLTTKTNSVQFRENAALLIRLLEHRDFSVGKVADLHAVELGSSAVP